MHVNPAIIGANSGRYNANSSVQNATKAAQGQGVSAAKTASVENVQGKQPVKQSEKQEEFSFWDLVDIVNPLQHIPIVSTIYREITGDRINGFGRIAGGAIFGGFAGAALGGLNALVKSDTGTDLGEMAMVKAGFRPDNAPHDEPINMVPVTEKDAAQKLAHERATLDTIIWDAPSLLQVATKESIAWDAPSIAIVEQPARSVDVAQKNNAAKTSEKAEQEVPAHVVRDVQPDAYKMAAAFDPASLNDIEPGNPASPLPQSAEHVKSEYAHVPQNMMQALSKYQSMQRFGGENAVAAQELKLADRQTDGSRKFAKLEGKIRRY